MEEQLLAEIEDLKSRVEYLEGVLFGLNDDLRFKGVVRSNIIIGEHTADKPTIISNTGKRYNIQTA